MLSDTDTMNNRIQIVRISE